METEKDDSIPTLDVIVKRSGPTLSHDVYRKKTHTDRYLHANSHPRQKRSVIATLLQRAERFCDINNKSKEIEYAKGALRRNSYTTKDIQRATKTQNKKQQQ